MALIRSAAVRDMHFRNHKTDFNVAFKIAGRQLPLLTSATVLAFQANCHPCDLILVSARDCTSRFLAVPDTDTGCYLNTTALNWRERLS